MSVKTEFENTVTACLNAMVGPFAKYVVSNYSSLSETTEDELTHTFREMMNLTKPAAPAPMPIGMAGIAPALGGAGMPAGFGNINVKEATPKKTRATKKDKPTQVWITLEQYQEEIKKGSKICGYTSKKTKDHKDLFCAAMCEDTSQADERDWRCVTCTGKKGDIYSRIPNSVHGINPSTVLPGLNVPAIGTPRPIPPIPSVPLPTMPPSLGAMPNLASLGLPKVPPVPTMPAIPPIPPMPSPKEARAPTPEPKTEEKPSFGNLVRHPGLNAEHLFSDNEDLHNILFKLDMTGGATALYAVGKFENELATPAPANYTSLLVELTQDEQVNLSRYEVTYKFGGAPALPTLPTLPIFRK